jgi:hypothetical protein
MARVGRTSATLMIDGCLYIYRVRRPMKLEVGRQAGDPMKSDLRRRSLHTWLRRVEYIDEKFDGRDYQTLAQVRARQRSGIGSPQTPEGSVCG